MREEGVRGLVPSHLASTEVLIDLTLAALPLLGPEPGLIRWDGQRWPQLDHPVLALGELDLRARLVQVVPPADRGRQRDDTARLHRDVTMKLLHAS